MEMKLSKQQYDDSVYIVRHGALLELQGIKNQIDEFHKKMNDSLVKSRRKIIAAIKNYEEKIEQASRFCYSTEDLLPYKERYTFDKNWEEETDIESVIDLSWNNAYKLKNANINTFEKLLNYSDYELGKIEGITANVIRKINEAFSTKEYNQRFK